MSNLTELITATALAAGLSIGVTASMVNIAHDAETKVQAVYQQQLDDLQMQLNYTAGDTVTLDKDDLQRLIEAAAEGGAK